jgi:hypothetical protein
MKMSKCHFSAQRIFLFFAKRKNFLKLGFLKNPKKSEDPFSRRPLKPPALLPEGANK